MYFQRGFCPDIVISQPIPPTLGMDLIKIERELFVFTGPFSQQYQEPDPKGKGK